MIINYRKISLFIGIFLIVFCCTLGIVCNIIYKDKEYDNEINEPYNDKNELSEIPEDYIVNKDFTSHLPLVVINASEEDFINNKIWNDDTHGYDDILDPEEVFTKCKISVYDDNGENKLSNDPTFTSYANIRYRGNSSSQYAKKQYLIKLIDKDSDSVKKDVMGMGKDNTWVLNGSMIDKSMLRNYLAYNTSRKIANSYVDSKYCEMFFKHNGKYKYMGVYLMIETIKQGENRIPIMKYRSKYAQTGYILKRDRYDKWGVTLNNYAYKKHLNYGALTVKYPSEDEITDKTIKYIEDDISKFEKALYSNKLEEFIKYRDYIDMNSFVDYFLINEFFGNYDAGNNSTYIYKQLGGKITMGPTWDFDGAMDNYNHAPFDYDATAFQEAPWFDRMLLDPYFCHKLIERYKELRKDVLSDKVIIEDVDNIVSYLGKAQSREWSRWGNYYINSKYLVDGYNMHKVFISNRNLNTYDEEISKIKNVVLSHAHWLDRNINSLYMKTNTIKGIESEAINEIDSEDRENFNIGAVGAALFILMFIIAIILIQRD